MRLQSVHDRPIFGFSFRHEAVVARQLAEVACFVLEELRSQRLLFEKENKDEDDAYQFRGQRIACEQSGYLRACPIESTASLPSR